MHRPRAVPRLDRLRATTSKDLRKIGACWSVGVFMRSSMKGCASEGREGNQGDNKVLGVQQPSNGRVSVVVPAGEGSRGIHGVLGDPHRNVSQHKGRPATASVQHLRARRLAPIQTNLDGVRVVADPGADMPVAIELREDGCGRLSASEMQAARDRQGRELDAAPAGH